MKNQPLQSDLHDALAGVGEDLILEAGALPEKQTTPTAHRFSRRVWILAAAILALCLLIGGVTAAAIASRTEKPVENTTTGEQEIVLPPVRLGRGTVSFRYIRSYDFNEAIENAELIATVRIGNWLGEDTDLYCSYYEAFVIDRLKGEPAASIVLRQPGCSLATVAGNPLYAYGDEILAFLNYDPNENCYWMLNGSLTTFRIARDQNGSKYLLYIGNTGFTDSIGAKDQRNDADLRIKLYASVYGDLLKADEYADHDRRQHIYSYDDVREAILVQ